MKKLDSSTVAMAHFFVDGAQIDRCKLCGWSKSIHPESDLEIEAFKLVEEGWLSVSNKYHDIARMKPGFEAADLIRPKMLETEAGKLLAEAWERVKRQLLRVAGPEMVERRTLDDKLYQVFRDLGGRSA